MKFRLQTVLAGAVTAAIAAGGLLSAATPALAGPTAPPWEPDSNAASPYANIVFYDAQGNQVTSGTNLSSPFAYAAATSPADAGSTKAILSFGLPQNGVVPANWNQTTESGNTTFSPVTSLPGSTPADVKAFAPTYPVVVSAANITTWLNSHIPDTTPGYTNTIEVRLQDTQIQGTTNYWDTDIGYNTTSSPITVDGTTVPANGWAQLFPFISSTSTSLTTSATGGNLATGNPITLTAAVSPSGTGSMNFYDNGTFLANSPVSGGTATDTYTPAQGSHSYTASFIPGSTPGSETGANTASAAIVGGSSSSPVSVNIGPATSTSASASASSITYAQSVTFTATVTPTDGGGGVAFTATNNSTNATTTLCPAQPLSNVGGSFQAGCTNSGALGLTPGTYSITATYSGDASYLGSSGTTNLSVIPATPTVSVTGSPNPGSTGPVSYTGSVSGPGVTPTGTVSVADGKGGSCTITLKSGSGACSINEFAANSPYSITAQYSGDSNYTTATASTQETVNKAATSLSAAPATPSGAPPSMVLSATLTSGGRGVANEAITFTAGGTPLVCTTAATTNASGVATCTVSDPSSEAAILANRGYMASFAGDANYLGSTANGTLLR